jgi:hypothetical protein
MADRREHAETVALAALAWLAAEETGLSAFLWASGMTAADLRARAGEPEVLAAVLDHVMADDGRVIAFCADQGLAPQVLAGLRAALPGGGLPNWT